MNGVTINITEKYNDIVDIDHVLRNIGIYRVVGSDIKNRYVTVSRCGGGLCTLGFYGPNQELKQVYKDQFTNGTKFIKTDEKLSVTFE